MLREIRWLLRRLLLWLLLRLLLLLRLHLRSHHLLWLLLLGRRGLRDNNAWRWVRHALGLHGVRLLLPHVHLLLLLLLLHHPLLVQGLLLSLHLLLLHELLLLLVGLHHARLLRHLPRYL